MLNRKIALTCYGILEDTEVTAEKRAEKRAATYKTFYEAMEMNLNDIWEMSDEDTPHIFFYQEEEGDPILQEGEPLESEGHEDNYDFDSLDYFYPWRENIYEARLKKAAEWLFSRQSVIQKCHELGLRPFLAIDVDQVDNEYFSLPSQFVTACGQANLPIVLSLRKEF